MDLGVEISAHLMPILEDQRNDDNNSFSEKSTFCICEVVNEYNCRTWKAINPFTSIEAAMNSPTVSVECATSNKQIIGP